MKQLYKRLARLAVCMLPFVAMTYYAPVFKDMTVLNSPSFLYQMATRSYWYVWVVPVVLILFGRYLPRFYFTAVTFISAFIANRTGDIDYLLHCNDFPGYPYYTKHFPFWLQYILLACVVYRVIWAIVKWAKGK